MTLDLTVPILIWAVRFPLRALFNQVPAKWADRVVAVSFCILAPMEIALAFAIAAG